MTIVAGATPGHRAGSSRHEWLIARSASPSNRFSPAFLAIALLSMALVFSCARADSLSGAEIAAYAQAKRHYLQGDYEGAIASLEAERFTYGRGHQALLLRAKAEFLLGRAERAEPILVRLVKRYPRYPEATLWLSRTLVAEGKIDQAETTVERAMRWDPDDPRFLAVMADVQERKKDYQKAFEYRIRAVDFADETGKEELELAELYWRFTQNDKALERIARARAMISDRSALARPLEELETRLTKGKQP